jgi:hypothetical protein
MAVTNEKCLTKLTTVKGGDKIEITHVLSKCVFVVTFLTDLHAYLRR